MFHREEIESEYRTLFEHMKFGLISYGPLFGGVLSGKYLHGEPTEGRFASEKTGGWPKEVLK